MQSTTHLTVRCSVHPPQVYSTRKATACLRAFIPICAEAKRPNGRLKWQILQKLWICSIGICPLKFNPKEYP